MKAIIVAYLVAFVLDMLRDLSKRSTNTIDDQLVETLNENMEEIKSYINKKV